MGGRIGQPSHPLTREDNDCIRMWNDYALLDRLPHELGYSDVAYPEDIEAIKTMKKWVQDKAESDRKGAEAMKRVQEKVPAMRGA